MCTYKQLDLRTKDGFCKFLDQFKEIVSYNYDIISEAVSDMTTYDFYQDFIYMNLEDLVKTQSDKIRFPLEIKAKVVDEMLRNAMLSVKQMEILKSTIGSTNLKNLYEDFIMMEEEDFINLLPKIGISEDEVRQMLLDRLSKSWNYVGEPEIDEEYHAVRVGLLPFYYKDQLYLASDEENSDIRYEAYFILSFGSLPANSLLNRIPDQFKQVLGEELYRELKESVTLEEKEVKIFLRVKFNSDDNERSE